MTYKNEKVYFFIFLFVSFLEKLLHNIIMKKQIAFSLLLCMSAITLTGCDFFDILFGSSSDIPSILPISIDGDGSTTKQTLNYTMKDYVDRSVYNIAVTPSVGNPKILVVPIAFKDSSDFIDESDKQLISSQLEKAIFGSNSDIGWHSVSSFYLEESYGKCNITGEVAPWYTSNYTYDQINSSDKSATVVNEAVNHWKMKNPNKIQSYDSNSDGYLDGVIAIYGGPNYSTGDLSGHPSNSNMWAYTSWTKNSKNRNNPNVKNYIWASYDFMYIDTTHVSIDTHTYIHETGHLFGLDDYYDYNQGSRYDRKNRYNWAGGFSMQDYNVGGHDPYSKLLLNWVNPYVPTNSSTITLKPFESSGDLILLTNNYSSSCFDEYFLLEYYTPTGVNELDTRYSYNGAYPSGVTTSGIRLWHVDARLARINTSSQVTEGNYSYYTDYVLTTNFNEGGLYVIGPTNTSYSTKPNTNNGYCSSIKDLLNVRLLDLVRKNDVTSSERGALLENSHLFTRGSSFNISNYNRSSRTNGGYFKEERISYFETRVTMNDGSSFDNWTIYFGDMNSEGATITLVNSNDQPNNNNSDE